MFEKYTEKARRVIFFARYEASQLGAVAIEPHHILLGLIREDPQLISRFCALTPAQLDVIRNKIRAVTGESAKVSAYVDMPLSVHAKHVLTCAADESQLLNHRHIGTEHLLLGLLREYQTTAAEILIELGVDFNTVRDELRDRTVEKSGISITKETGVEEIRRLAAEARILATAMLRKADRIEAICDQLTRGSSDQKADS